MIDDLAPLPLPYFVYYDASWDALIASADSTEMYAAHRLITPSNMKRRRERQLIVYEQAAGIIAMSHWFARSLIKQSGIPAQKIHVVHPGISAGRTYAVKHLAVTSEGTSQSRAISAPLPERHAPRRRLLFVGRQYVPVDFYGKGCDLAISALTLLRREYDPRITLTVVGADRWPLPGPSPEGVHFRGTLPPEQVAELYDSHDLFVMPSRRESFGIALAEALARGLPCVARSAYAMPEIVTPGVSGSLITSDDEHELAEIIATALADDTLYERCYARAPEMAAYFSWERAARDIVSLISREIS